MIDDYGKPFPSRRHMLLFQPLFKAFGNAWFRARAHGFEQVPDHRPVIYVCKHPKGFLYLETLAFGATTVFNSKKRPFRVLEKRNTSMHKMPLLNLIRQNVGAIEATEPEALAAIKRNESLLMFPGGARELYGESDELNWGGRTGFARIAALSGAPVVPMAWVGADQQHPLRLSLGKDKSLWLPLFPLPVPLDFWFGAPMEPPKSTDSESVAQFAEKVLTQTRELLLQGLSQRRPIWSLT